MLLRLIMAYLLLLCACYCYAQNDTTFLKELTIQDVADKQFLAGSTIRALDSTLKEVNQSQHLGELLSFQFPIHFRNYGNGMLSSISMRGTSAQHTAVLWNGININSFSLGQADFSMLPAAAFDSVQLHAGGGSARFGSGAFGGTVLLGTNHARKNQIVFTQEVASFHKYFSTLSAGFHKGPLSYSLSGYMLQSENDFPVMGTQERQDNAALNIKGTTQNIRYQVTKHSAIGVQYWYHYADRELQPTIGTVNNRDEQQDENHRLLIDYELNHNATFLQVKAGVIDDDIIYNKSKSNVRRWVAAVNQQFVVCKNWHVEWSGNMNHAIGNIKNYPSGRVTENRYEVALSINRSFEKVSVAANIRQPFISFVNAPLLLYVGSDVVLFEKRQKSITAKANLSRNFRAPTLNDRYWENAGDVNLLPEVSYAAESGFGFSVSQLQVELTGFYQSVNEWIQWKPIGENGRFVPRNLAQVEVTGLEVATNYMHKIDHGFLRGRLVYQPIQSIITKASAAEERTLGKQLIYTPKHTLSGFFTLHYRQWRTLLSLQGTGKRFTDDTNTNRFALDPYLLTDFSMGRTLGTHRNRFTLYASVKNIMNADYQLYSARAQPGRNFSIQLNYQFNPTSK